MILLHTDLQLFDPAKQSVAIKNGLSASFYLLFNYRVFAPTTIRQPVANVYINGCATRSPYLDNFMKKIFSVIAVTSFVALAACATQITVSISGAGYVESINPPGTDPVIQCGTKDGVPYNKCSAPLSSFAAPNLPKVAGFFATPAPGYYFVRWTGGTCEGLRDPICRFDISNGGAGIQAIFAKNTSVQTSNVSQSIKDCLHRLGQDQQLMTEINYIACERLHIDGTPAKFDLTGIDLFPNLQHFEHFGFTDVPANNSGYATIDDLKPINLPPGVVVILHDEAFSDLTPLMKLRNPKQIILDQDIKMDCTQYPLLESSFSKDVVSSTFTCF